MELPQVQLQFENKLKSLLAVVETLLFSQGDMLSFCQATLRMPQLAYIYILGLSAISILVIEFARWTFIPSLCDKSHNKCVNHPVKC
jgi:hypothetical protein